MSPSTDLSSGYFTDAKMAETISEAALEDRFCWVSGLGWLAWDGKVWARCSDATMTEVARQYVLSRFSEALEQARAQQDTPETKTLDGWRSLLHAGRQRAILGLARGIVERRVEELDANPDLLNTPSGVVDLRTGAMQLHSPRLLLTKITAGSYRPGFSHADWAKALEALPEAERRWLQVRIGQAITGHTTPDGVLPVLQGAGENGKSLLTTDGPVPALGDYASMASTKLFQSTKGTEHSTERANLRGRRLLVAEELTEGRALDVTALKQVQDVGTITARYIRQDNIEFTTSHSLFTTTNYVPVVSEVDHGTWRRLALVRFPYTFRKPTEPLDSPSDRPGDPQLKARIKAGREGQHDAIVTWAVEGAVRWYQEPSTALAPTERIERDTRRWRTEADRILGYWDECLIPDRDACVLVTELREHFNEWLAGNGHNTWSKELFGPRFAQHRETTRHGVTEQHPRTATGLRRRPRGEWSALAETPARPRIYRGVRYRELADEVSDQQESESGTSGTTLWDNGSQRATNGGTPRGRAGRATPDQPRPAS